MLSRALAASSQDGAGAVRCFRVNMPSGSSSDTLRPSIVRSPDDITLQAAVRDAAILDARALSGGPSEPSSVGSVSENEEEK